MQVLTVSTTTSLICADTAAESPAPSHMLPSPALAPAQTTGRCDNLHAGNQPAAGAQECCVQHKHETRKVQYEPIFLPNAQSAAQAVHIFLFTSVEVLPTLVGPGLLRQKLCKLSPAMDGGDDGT
jgi:hypothetical protein